MGCADFQRRRDYSSRAPRVRWSSLVVMTVSRDDVVLQRPEDLRFLVPVFHTSTRVRGRGDGVSCCVGSRIAPAPTRPASRRSSSTSSTPRATVAAIDKVQRWFGGRVSDAARARLPPAVPARRDADLRDPRVGARGPRLSRRDAADQLQDAPSAARRRRQGRDRRRRRARGRHHDRSPRGEGRRGPRDDRSVAGRQGRGARSREAADQRSRSRTASGTSTRSCTTGSAGRSVKLCSEVDVRVVGHDHVRPVLEARAALAVVA